VPILKVSLWKGRTADQKRELARELTDVMVRVGSAKPESTTILFDEYDKSDWATGGTLASDPK